MSVRRGNGWIRGRTFFFDHVFLVAESVAGGYTDFRDSFSHSPYASRNAAKSARRLHRENQANVFQADADLGNCVVGFLATGMEPPLRRCFGGPEDPDPKADRYHWLDR